MSTPVYRVGKSFRFEATRRLEDNRYDGRSFTAEVVLSSASLSPAGFVVDFGELSPLKRYIDGALDHQILNDAVKDTSGEGLAQHLASWARGHLPDGVASVLESVQVRAGRPQTPPLASFVAFDASHQLHGLREGHPCGRLHGHSYVLSVPVPAIPRLGDVPVLLRNHLRSAVDGRVLNEAIPDLNPTSEHLARHFFRWLEERDLVEAGSGVCVRVSETVTSWAEYTR
ncbi:6-pyruvoyl trahydropterin synthase family protein [Streptomyces alfalfae]